MSTFTDWNGPQGSDVRAQDLMEFAKGYAALVTKLEEHITSKAGNTGVHEVKSFVESLLDDYVSNNELDNRLTAFAKKTDLPSLADYVTAATLSGYATKAAVENTYATKQELTAYLRANSLESQEIIRAMLADISVLRDWVNSDEKTIDKLNVTEMTGRVLANEHIQFIDRTFAAPVGGSDIDGVYYILGMLANKAGVAFIRMGNTKPFSANINFAVTPMEKGALSVTTDCELADLKFKIVSGTDSAGATHYYLAIQSSEWISNFASTDGVGKFSSIEFDGAGINFYPVNSNGYVSPNGNCHDVCDCMSGKGFSFSELATVILNKQIYRDTESPYVTTKDITALDHVGVVSGWTDFDPDTRIATNVPEGYHACDGTDVLADDDVSDEFRDKYSKYPLIDYSIIKTKSTIHADIEGVDLTMQSLAEAVCSLHGINFYNGVNSLPDVAKIGKPVVVQSGRTYAVYVYTDDGWKKYSTDYNDINLTVGAIAAVIAAEHGADVYTVYSSVAELPTGPSVEAGALAIVFDGAAYSVFKYNGTAWEVQA